MKLNRIVCLSGTVLALAALSAQASIVTSSGAFVSATNPDRTVDTFTGPDGGVFNLGYSVSGTYGASVNSTTGGMYRDFNMLYTQTPADGILINGFSGGVSAIGANFFITDGTSGSGQAGSITVTVGYSSSPNDVVSGLAVTDNTTFRGFIAPSGETITSLAFSGATGFNNNSIDNLYLATTAVPEPSVWGFCVGSGLVVFGAYRRMRK